MGGIPYVSGVFTGFEKMEKLYSMYKKYFIEEKDSPDTHKVANDMNNNLNYRLPDIHAEVLPQLYKQVFFLLRYETKRNSSGC